MMAFEDCGVNLYNYVITVQGIAERDHTFSQP